jgi:predicted RNase H-like nuclease (RuvC/YqgF family)
MSRKPSPRPASRPSDRGRWSSKRKTEVVLRLLRGEPLDEVSRDVGVTASRLTRWRDDFLAAGQSGLMAREADSRDEEIKSLKTKLGDQLMTIELLEDKIDQLEDGLRPPSRRRKP